MARSASAVTVTPLLVAELRVEGERMPVNVHLIDHPGGRVLVDTGVEQLHPAMADMDPLLRPLREHDFDLATVDLVVSTHLHADHIGGNHLFPGTPFYVQRHELETALGQEGYTLPDWVQPPGVEYRVVDGEHELLPGLRLVPAPGHCDGLQMVVVESDDGPVVVGGDVVVWWGEYEAPCSEGQRRLMELDPAEIWVTHEDEPWRRGAAAQ